MRNNMKVIFLDFDGVLNSHPFLMRCVENGLTVTDKLDSEAVRNLNEIIEETGAKVVVSSTWRLFFELDELRNVLKQAGFKGEVIGVTPELGCEPRGFEIQDWLDENPGVESFVILDDVENMVHLKDRLVQTSFNTGLLKKHVADAVFLLEIPDTNL